MDGVAALSLACNILQLVDSAGTAIKIITQVYQNGRTRDNDTIESTTTHLRDLCREISSQIQSTAIKSTVLAKQFHEIARLNINLTEELIQELSTLKGQGSPWTKLKTGMKAVKRRSKIERLQQQLSDSERIFNTSILATLMERNEAFQVMQGEVFNDLDTVLQGFIVRLAQDHIQTTNLIKTEHAETRALIRHAGDTFASQFESSRLSERTQMMCSLRYPEMNARLNQIDEAYPETYDAIFEVSRPESFNRWFRQGQGILWIQGKAGSGKSTFMKFISQSPVVRNLISDHNTNVALIHHFFWLSGSPPQRNLHGLLCGLAYQVTELVEDVKYQNKLSTNDWSVKELEDFVLSSVQALTTSTTLVVVLDALDEYDEQCDKRKLLNLITKMSECSKICISSRPEPFWVKYLQHTPHVKLEEISKNAIRAFINQELQDAEITDPHELVDSLAEQAEGVFLWALIAVKDVLRGVDSNATKYELEQRIKRLPKGMENLYTSMLKRIDEDWPLVQQEAALYFSTILLLSNINWPTSFDSSSRLYCFHATSQFLLQQKPLFEDFASLERDCRRLKNRIIFVCAGMLETLLISTTASGDLAFNATVQFTHRTVRDFLLDAPYGRYLTNFKSWDTASVMCNLIETEYSLHCYSETIMDWESLWFMLYTVHLVQSDYKLDEKDHLKMILSIRKLLVAAMSSHFQRISGPVEFVHKDRIYPAGEPALCVSIDFLGLTLETNTMCYFNSLCLNVANFTLHYMEYLLFCSVHHTIRFQSCNAEHPWGDIWKILKPYGVTGKMQFWLPIPWLCNRYQAITTSMNELFFQLLLAVTQVHENSTKAEDFVELILSHYVGNLFDANDNFKFYVSIDYSAIKQIYECSSEEGGRALYVEGNAKYWLLIALSCIDISEKLRSLEHMEDYKAVAPFKRLLFIVDEKAGDITSDRGVPVFMNGSPSKSGEDGETLMQLWETSKRESRGYTQFEKRDREAMHKEACRLMQAVASCSKQTGTKSSNIIDNPLGEDYCSIKIIDYLKREGFVRDQCAETWEIPVFKD